MAIAYRTKRAVYETGVVDVRVAGMTIEKRLYNNIALRLFSPAFICQQKGKFRKGGKYAMEEQSPNCNIYVPKLSNMCDSQFKLCVRIMSSVESSMR